jgi:hypothetical protein
MKLVQLDAESLLGSALQIDASPAHDAVAGAIWTRFKARCALGFSLQ